MTIVGDLEQRISAKGGLITWESMGLEFPVQNIRRLVTNYRWSKRVFEFLAVYKTAAGLSVTLQKPYDWPSGDGMRPEVAHFPSRDLELGWLIRRIIDLRSTENSSWWTIAVILPESLAASISAKVISELRSCDIKTRWASGEDVKESTEQVILTDYESIVGLEFDAVFVAACDEVFKSKAEKEVVQSVWVAITRARQHIAVSYVEHNALFDGREFDMYRLA
jgi:DNA helicase IV